MKEKKSSLMEEMNESGSLGVSILRKKSTKIRDLTRLKQSIYRGKLMEGEVGRGTN